MEPRLANKMVPLWLARLHAMHMLRACANYETPMCAVRVTQGLPAGCMMERPATLGSKVIFRVEGLGRVTVG